MYTLEEQVESKDLFYVSRTSYRESKKPCSNSFTLRCKTTQKAGFICSKEYWLKEGQNHRFNKDTKMHERELYVDLWFSYVPDILNFVKNEGKPCIISATGIVKNLPSIEIYDDYRE